MPPVDPERRREQWPIRIYRLGEEPGDDLSALTTPEQRLEMVTLLTARMWELTGQPFPSYARSAMPVRIIRPS
jgi:hypothetical protein